MFKKLKIILILVFLFVSLVSCNSSENNISKDNPDILSNKSNVTQKEQADSLSPHIVRYDPKTTFAGMDFNLHDGKSVIWMEVRNLKKSVIVVWEGRQLSADKNPELTLLSFVVPKDLYSTPGSYEIYLLDVETGLKSKSVYFTVQ